MPLASLGRLAFSQHHTFSSRRYPSADSAPHPYDSALIIVTLTEALSVADVKARR